MISVHADWSHPKRKKMASRVALETESNAVFWGSASYSTCVVYTKTIIIIHLSVGEISTNITLHFLSP